VITPDPRDANTSLNYIIKLVDGNGLESDPRGGTVYIKGPPNPDNVKIMTKKGTNTTIDNMVETDELISKFYEDKINFTLAANSSADGINFNLDENVDFLQVADNGQA
jgi:hypothetical protein